VPQLTNYALGTAALCAGQSWAEAQRGRSWLRPWGYAAAGGAACTLAVSSRRAAPTRRGTSFEILLRQSPWLVHACLA
jgi:hypothetical protein